MEDEEYVVGDDDGEEDDDDYEFDEEEEGEREVESGAEIVGSAGASNLLETLQAARPLPSVAPPLARVLVYDHPNTSEWRRSYCQYVCYADRLAALRAEWQGAMAEDKARLAASKAAVLEAIRQRAPDAHPRSLPVTFRLDLALLREDNDTTTTSASNSAGAGAAAVATSTTEKRGKKRKAAVTASVSESSASSAVAANEDDSVPSILTIATKSTYGTITSETVREALLTFLPVGDEEDEDGKNNTAHAASQPAAGRSIASSRTRTRDEVNEEVEEALKKGLKSKAKKNRVLDEDAAFASLVFKQAKEMVRVDKEVPVLQDTAPRGVKLADIPPAPPEVVTAIRPWLQALISLKEKLRAKKEAMERPKAKVAECVDYVKQDLLQRGAASQGINYALGEGSKKKVFVRLVQPKPRPARATQQWTQDTLRTAINAAGGAAGWRESPDAFVSLASSAFERADGVRKSTPMPAPIRVSLAQHRSKTDAGSSSGTSSKVPRVPRVSARSFK